MNYKEYILFFFLITFCFTNCGKYPEGPAFSLRSKERRLLGSWHVESFTVDGADSISPSICQRYYFYDTEGAHRGVSSSCDSTIFDGEWKFVDHKKKLRVNGSPV